MTSGNVDRWGTTIITPPKVSFEAASGISLSTQYRTSIYVLNDTLGVPLIVQLDANLAVTGGRPFDEPAYIQLH